MKKLMVQISANTCGVSFVVRVNGGNTALIIVTGAGETGLFTVETDVGINDNDLLCLEAGTGSASGSATFSITLLFQPA